MEALYQCQVPQMNMEFQGKHINYNTILRNISDPHRRYILQILCDRTSCIGLRELATNLVARVDEKPLIEVGQFEVSTISKTLVHSHLPKLESSGLIAWNQDEETITTTDHPALSDPTLQQIIEVNVPGWDDILSSLAHKRRRIVLAALKDYKDAISETELAKEIHVREHDDPAEPNDTPEDLLINLYHIHLPKLRDAGLIEYDSDAGMVSYRGHSELEDEWLDFRPKEIPSAIVPTAQGSDSIWTIEGRDNVIARGQSLFEQADDELFLMFTADGLLEDGCIRRLQDAVDRGVDVYLGSQTQEVRDLVREEIPAAVIWEPQMDWLNLPPEYEKIGRLVFADQEAIMLATLGDETDGGRHNETAITGVGENNLLVVLLRDMLGSRLDYLDAQSEGLLSDIPL